MSLANGGHLTHGSPVNFSGKHYNMVSYGLDANGYIDYDQVRALAKEHRPKMIIAGASAYPREIRFDVFADIARETGAYLFVDMAHIAGNREMLDEFAYNSQLKADKAIKDGAFKDEIVPVCISFSPRFAHV